MTRRSFFSRFATIAGALLAAPKALLGFKGTAMGCLVPPGDPLSKGLGMRRIYAIDPAYGKDQSVMTCFVIYEKILQIHQMRLQAGRWRFAADGEMVFDNHKHP